MNPVVRYMILCEDVRRQRSNPTRIDLIGILTVIRSTASPSYPYILPSISVFIQVSWCRGDGVGRIEIVESDSGRTIRRTTPRTIKLPINPLTVEGFFFRLEGTIFPRPGLYDFVFRYNDAVLKRTPLEMR